MQHFYQYILAQVRAKFERDRQQPVTHGVWESGCKFQAEMLLIEDPNVLKVPTYEEWLGMNLLERDDKLERRKR